MVHDLNKRKTLTVQRRKTASIGLTQQKAEFTAEGAPVPGNVGTQPPVTLPATVTAADAEPRAQHKPHAPGAAHEA